MKELLYGIAMMLFVASMVVFVVGMIKPSVLGRFLGTKANRKFIALITVAVFIGSAVFGSAIEPAGVKQDRLNRENAAKVAQLQREEQERLQAQQLAEQQKAQKEQSQQQSEADKAKQAEADKKAQEANAVLAAQRDAEAEKVRRRNYWHRVVRVVDGDTVRAMVDGKDESIRIIGIDAPEATTSNECFGTESTAKAKEFLEGKWIQLEVDDSQGARDKYGRLLAYVWFDSGTDFGRRLMEEGYAYEYTYQSAYQKQAQYKETEAYAKSKQHGLWATSTCSGKRAKPDAAAAPAPAPAPTPAPEPSGSNCDPNYTPCIPYKAGNTLNCPDIRKKVRVIGIDHHKFDANNDGWGCESYN